MLDPIPSFLLPVYEILGNFVASEHRVSVLLCMCKILFIRRIYWNERIYHMGHGPYLYCIVTKGLSVDDHELLFSK